MKKFCINCGHQTEYFRVKDKPTKCTNCGFSFVGASNEEPSREEAAPVEVPFKVTISSDTKIENLGKLLSERKNKI